jgi:large subunit ribosomal protein L30
MSALLEITLKKGWIGTSPNQRQNLTGLGLFHRERSIFLPDNPSTRGMVSRVLHLVEVKKVSSKPVSHKIPEVVKVAASKEPVKAKKKTPPTTKTKKPATKKEKLR